MIILPYLDKWIEAFTAYHTYQEWFEHLRDDDIFESQDGKLELGFFCMYDQVEFHE